jgi:C-terminal processing protease CtpA/Prc
MTPSSVSHTKDDLPDARLLSEFRSGATQRDVLGPRDMRRIAQLARRLLDDYYVHLPFKRAMHAIDPLRSLRLLERRAEDLDPRSFHDEMLAVFADLRDRHTVYWVPEPYRNQTAALPFRIQRTRSEEGHRYLVSEVTEPWLPREAADQPRFEPGVEVTHWNAVPIERAIQLYERWDAGANPEARRARGIALLTDRPLTFAPLPDEDWVDLLYRAGGQDAGIRLQWRVFELKPGPGVRERTEVEGASAYELGLDPVAEAVRRSQKLRFRPEYVRIEAQVAEGREPPEEGPEGEPVSTLPDHLQYRVYEREDRRYGYLRIRSFDVPSVGEFTTEVQRILGEMKAPDGLIIDVRGNGGGKIEAGERLLQLFTPQVIQPEGVQFLSTWGTRRIVEGPSFERWQPSLSRTELTGEAFSGALPLRDRYGASCNEIGQRYYGPAVLIVDALCYSTTDVFAAGFQDNEVGCKVIGTDGRTGAGGGNPWSVDAIEWQAHQQWERPEGVSFDIAVRRSLRVGEQAGVPLEGMGVKPDVVHELTERDVMGKNEDLLDEAIGILAGEPSYALDSTVEWRDGVARITVRSRGITQLDVYLDGRPSGRPVPIEHDETLIEVSAAPDRSHYYRLYGFDDRNELVAARRDRFGSGQRMPGRVQMSPVLIGDPPADGYE